MDVFRKAGRKFEETKQSVMGDDEDQVICEECGEFVAEDDQYCPQCGAEVVDEEE